MGRTGRIRRIQWRLFAAAGLAYAFFHQGGGWNQNARFAMVRAVVEAGRLDVDTHILYTGVARDAGGVRFRRTPVDAARFDLGGARWVLAWPDAEPQPLRPPEPGDRVIALDQIAASGDLAFAGGHLHPNKAPGTALLGVPAYFALFHAEHLLGLDPDGWWLLTVNAWLTTALSVGLVSALGCVLFFRAALSLWPARPGAALGASLAFAFGTPFFPYATLFVEQNLAAAGLLGAFLGVRAASREPTPERAGRRLVGAGLAAGLACLASYLAMAPLLLVGVWACARVRPARRLGSFALGAAVPLLALGLYQAACFGSAFTTAYAFQNPLFRDAGGWLGVLGPPSLERLAGVLVSPYRGLFFVSPVLLLGAVGWLGMLRARGLRAEALLCAAIVLCLVGFNVCFNGWHGGWSVGPRYLGPALPFLALPLTPVCAARPRLAGALAALSIGITFLLVAVDAQPPVGSSPIAERAGRPRLLRDAVSEYALPIYASGRATPILEAQRRADPEAPRPLELFRGPVSANPIGVYEAWVGRALAPPAPELAWNAFNAGELLLPGSRLSPLLLLLPLAPLLRGALRAARRPEG